MHATSTPVMLLWFVRHMITTLSEIYETLNSQTKNKQALQIENEIRGWKTEKDIAAVNNCLTIAVLVL
jgi:hypothetical protein